MSIDNQEEYKLQNGQTISIQRNIKNARWEVGCWNTDDTMHWYKEFDKKEDAIKEFNRWK